MSHATPTAMALGAGAAPATLPVIKLSADFLKMLKMDAATAYALSPAFACRLERFTNQGVWLPRAIVITTEGILRLFDCASGRITHAMDLAHICSDDASMNLDAPPATVHRYAHIQATIDARPVSNAEDGQHQCQCVRLVARCPMRLSVDEMMMRSDANKAPGGVVTFEDDILLRFHWSAATERATTNLAQSFLGALRHFCAQREATPEKQPSFSMSRSQEPLQNVVERAMQESATMDATTSVADRNVRHRKKPNRLAATLNVFKREISSIRALGAHERREVEAAGGTIVEPPSPPRRIDDVEGVLAPSTQRGEEENKITAKPVGGSAPQKGLRPEDAAMSEEDLMAALVQPGLLTIPLNVQRTARIPAIFVELLKEKRSQLQAARRANLERLARLKLLKAHVQETHDCGQQEATLAELTERAWLDLVDDVMVPYSHAKVEIVETFARSLLFPLPQFDEHGFQVHLLEAMDQRDGMQDELENLEAELQSAERKLDVELREDPVRLMAANESAKVMEQLQSLQETLKRHRASICQTVETEKAMRTVECEDVLMDQERELQRLRGLLKSMRSVYVLHKELVSNVPSSGQATECNAMSAASRRVRMNLDV